MIVRSGRLTTDERIRGTPHSKLRPFSACKDLNLMDGVNFPKACPSLADLFRVFLIPREPATYADLAPLLNELADCLLIPIRVFSNEPRGYLNYDRIGTRII